jgi:hypothetical protein
MKIFFSLLLFFTSVFAQTHPNLLIKKSDIKEIQDEWNKYPLFRKTFEDARAKMELALANPIDVPVPKDAAAYTHERHKKNYTEMQLAGILYQVTKEVRYAEFIKKMLLKYADLYPALKQHPAAASNSPGRMFWQSLNEYVWAVHTTQAYDCIYDYLTPGERKLIEDNIFRKMADFFVTERVHELDLIHNHGTWSCAAVGMIGIVLKDKDLIDKALYGSKKDKEAGFLKQIELLFSPDGFYTEGAYYARYALMPFFVFAEALNNNLPELKIFEFRDQILKKGFYATIQQTYTNGAFIPINDALKEKNYLSPELAIALDLIFKHYGGDPALLDIAKKQNIVMLNGAGITVARELSMRKILPDFNYKSIEYSDGANGDEGGIALIRSGAIRDQSLLVMKYTGHGLSHGHYDKLSFLYYDQGREIIQDYGSARFLNIEPKYGGRYLPENKSFAMQTIAHNTVTVDEKSDFGGKIEVSEKNHSDRHFFSASDSTLQIVSAKDLNSYKDVSMQRSMAMINDARFTRPVVIDIFNVKSKDEHHYDLSYYYMGHLIDSNIKYEAHTKERSLVGKENGYQHLWNEAEGKGNGKFQITWLNGERFYTITSNADTTTKIIFTRLGGSDPNFNLRPDPGVMLRWKGKSHLFASVLEPHGNFDGVNEFSAGAKGIIEEINVLGSDDECSIIQIKGKQNLNWLLMINNGPASDNRKHSAEFNGIKYEWTGNYSLRKNQ